MTEHRAFFNSYKPKSTQGIFKHVMECLPENKQGISIDLCCGAGRLTDDLSEQGYQAFGMDISESFIATQSDRQGNFAVADVIANPLADDCADLVTFIDSLQYFEDPDAMIAETARLLKPGGTLIMSCQNNYNPAGIKKWLIQTLTGKTWSPWLVHPVENFLLYPDIITMLENNGYTIEYVRGKQFLTVPVSLLPSFIRNWSPWKDKPWRSLASVASRVSLPRFIEESFMARFAMIVMICVRKS